MKILALDSSGLVASVALVTEDELLAEYTVNYKKTHSQTLLPMLGEIVTMIGLDLSEIDAIAVSSGPGSFTGLRIGSATAKGLGYALDKPIISVPTLDALAYNLYGTDKIICPIMDARRKQVYTGLYEFNNNDFKVVMKSSITGIMDIIKEINNINKEVIFIGDAVPIYKEMIKDNIKPSFSFSPSHLSRQRAGAVGALSIDYYKNNKTETSFEHAPVYLRLSQAERELKEKAI
ncbi:MAG TPA: tRNA (adenosine(37)-N6)-threonylcarbamoyltransferase complex dimerization subunit type 1 TsaB [Clostridiales bacterium]|nr:tRNA (adenosine(37)-N6)-threonylcarbamoyltransferase complex dimerization subunit type 1 TsaB [Clostridiales bacterium]